jgi:hypothetical protein
MRNAAVAVAIVSASLVGAAAAAPPPHQAGVAGWAKRAGYRLAAPRTCTGPEEKAFQALGATCWRVKHIAPVPAGSAMHPRLVLRLQTFADEAAAKARIARFHAGVKDHPELEKAYPLRAGFRIGERVLVVTTDAYVFEPDAYRAAVELSARLGGTELVCCSACTAP